MRYCIGHSDQILLDHLKTQMPAIMGDKLRKITKTSKFEDSYSSRIFKQPVIIKKLYKFSDDGFSVTFRNFLKIENDCITYTPTPLNYLNTMIDDAILKFNLLNSFVYRNFKDDVASTDGFDSLKFDLTLDIYADSDSFRIENIQIKSYYSLFINQSRSFYLYTKDQVFVNEPYLEIRYTKNRELVTSSNLLQFIKKIEAVWGHSFNFDNLNVVGMKTITEMLLI